MTHRRARLGHQAMEQSCQQVLMWQLNHRRVSKVRSGQDIVVLLTVVLERRRLFISVFYKSLCCAHKSLHRLSVHLGKFQFFTIIIPLPVSSWPTFNSVVDQQHHHGHHLFPFRHYHHFYAYVASVIMTWKISLPSS